ncbi:recombinase family protein [Lysinibacillus sphaericus]|uniref:recombinase family protein n=1 Tax=Lysinibacillus sphaericus TaxID=1421 RepID=UPI0018CDBF32|nr:recombinase family protein [Lysinibacillus sphaericus]MBG9754286.1 hypothetical protein [Lysinibacillus sphaericus]QTB13120.1 recombinase family protein [Lysinibacillus sphaericus]
MKKLAFGYVRRSSYKQLDNNSVELQKQHIQEFASRNGLNVPDEFIFIEEATSAYSKRAGQRKVLMLLKEKMVEMNVSTVIFHDASRMDRTGYSFTIDFYRPLLEKLPCLEVYTTKNNEPINPDSTEMKMNFLLFQHESEVKSERAIGSLLSDLEQETIIRPDSKTPYGYNQKDKKLYPNEAAEIVSFIFFLYSWGYSLNKIASLLNEADIPSPKGKQWGSSTIENIIKNPVYTGDLTWEVHKRKEGQSIFIFKNAHKPIINNFLLQSHSQNKLLQEKYGRFDTPFLFLNKLKCKHCQQVLATQNASTKRKGKSYQYYYYVCKLCNYKVVADEVHEILMPSILEQVHSLAMLKNTQQQTLEYLTQMQGNVEEQILNTENLIDNLMQKTILAEQLGDRELELAIFSCLGNYQDRLIELQRCRDNLMKTYQSVESNYFSSLFQNILTHQLNMTEKRLIILYFVDFVLLSAEFKTTIHFKTNIFDEYLSSVNG